MRLFNLSKVTHTELSSPDGNEKFSFSADMAAMFGFENVCAFHDIVPPGRRSSLPHIHSTKEELVFVLAGTPTLKLGEETRQLKPGDYVGFRPGERPLHVIENRSDETAEILVIASHPRDDVPIYE